MTDKIFNLQIRLVADNDRGHKENKKLLEHLLGTSIKRVLPEAIVLNVNIKPQKEIKK